MKMIPSRQGWKAMTLDYQAFLAETFRTLQQQQIKHLIIDIRQNTGGSDEMKDELFSYLMADATYPIVREGRTRYLHFPDTLRPYIQTWGDNPWYYELQPENKERQNGYYTFPQRAQPTEKQGKKDLYTGKVYMLISAANTSLAYYTARHFDYADLGPTIGQETGGNLNDINGGQILFLRLPNTGIEIDFPVMGGFTLEAQPNSGVVPDVPTTITREDIRSNRDVELDAVLQLILQR